MRALALHPDVIVLVSDIWQTTCTAVRAGDEGFVIDSPVYPEELRALPQVLEQAGFPVSGLLTTHGDWDHLLGRTAFPDTALGCGEPTAARLAGEPGDAQRELRQFDAEHYVDGRPPLTLGSLQPLPVPGRVSLGSGPSERELELHGADGHTEDGTAYWLAWARVLVCGDYLSPVEIPMLSEGGSIDAYRATLARLATLVEQAEWVVPGHGAPVPAQRSAELLAQDCAYLAELTSRGSAATLPGTRTDAFQRQIHESNVALVGARPEP
ncbi:MAG: MBL fold metallo-hydrolase [Solirubrobacteraceae bacterium]